VSVVPVLHRATAYLIIVIGVVHVSVTPAVFETFTVRTADFVCRGLMAIFLSFLNIAHFRARGSDPLLRWLCLGANSVTTLLWAAVLVAVKQSAGGLFVVSLFALLTMASFALREESPGAPSRSPDVFRGT
jgi:hypothetical protein